MQRADVLTPFFGSVFLCLLLVSTGCETIPEAPASRSPVRQRFSPWDASTGAPQVLGLAVQCAADPVQVRFSERLATLVAREIELAVSSTHCVAWQPVVAYPSAPQEFMPSSQDVITVSFQEPHSITPPESPVFPTVVDVVPETPARCLQIRVMEFRPYSPLAATLRLTILDGQTQQIISSTSASWNIGNLQTTGTSGGNCNSVVTLEEVSLHDEPPTCESSAMRHSPEALTQTMASRIAAWYAMRSAVVIPSTVLP
ncbi:MAG: hypothetical protein KDA91_03330 [Planctomycetaceae bacterium]|nr:hypothetical protein [Planctomycetaceae bacterium]